MDWSNCLQGGGNKVATLNCVPSLFSILVNVALIFAGITAVFFIIIAGIKFINSSGDPKRLEGAQKTLTFAILGLVVVLGSFFLIHFIATITGASCITKFGFNNCQ